MLKDKRRIVERLAKNRRLRMERIAHYGEFLRMLFSIGDWFVTLSFRDRHQDSERATENSKRSRQAVAKLAANCDNSVTVRPKVQQLIPKMLQIRR
jgi:hypothetical protein